jgi:hypothetical protein
MRHLGILAALFVANTAFAEPAVDVQARIFNYFLERAEKGDASAQFIVGFRYESGSGTERDMKKAMEWYTKAAAKGHEQARERIGAPASPPPAPAPVAAPAPAPLTVAKPEPAPAPAPKVVAKAEIKKPPEAAKPKARAIPKPAPAVVASAAKHADTSRATAPAAAPSPVPRASPVLVQAASSEKPATSTTATAEPAPAAAPVASTVVSTETVTPPAPEKKPAEAPAINALEVVLSGKWARNEVAPDYLPSSNTSCLRAGGDKIVCFSGGAQAHVDGNAVMYAVKSTLSDFSPNGAFRVQYVFNVTDVTADASAAASDSRDLFGLASRLGWQEPGLTLDCSVNEAGRITCLRNGRQQLTFYRQ